MSGSYKKIQQMAEQLAAQTKTDFFERFECLGYDVFAWTPIEELMAYGLLHVMRNYEYYGGCGDNDFVDTRDFERLDPLNLAWAPRTFGIKIFPQWPVGRYRADFVISIKDSRGPTVVGAIECDGHNFHEKTKDQAQRDKARDRYFQQAGMMILRYSGSEIWADPVKCAVEALGILHGQAALLARRQ